MSSYHQFKPKLSNRISLQKSILLFLRSLSKIQFENHKVQAELFNVQKIPPIILTKSKQTMDVIIIKGESQ